MGLARTFRGEIAMNIHSNTIERDLSREDAQDALAVLRRWASQASAGEVRDLDPQIQALLPGQVADYPQLSRDFPADFQVTADYKASLPDLQNGPSSLIRGAHQRIQHVGISNFRLPLHYAARDGGTVRLDTSVTGSVSLEADKKGINMSRIMRSFYKHADGAFGFDLIAAALADYQTDLESLDARIQLAFSLPLQMDSLRSGLAGYQYYDVVLEMAVRNGVQTRMVHLDYVYSSTCPCSLELSEHARATRGQLATPHSQRSVARMSLVVDPDAAPLWVEDVIDMARRAVPTETQVMVKREDEQAFAELNAANPIFVEDAARLFCEQLQADTRVGDFRVVASHQESLHSHDAVSVLTEGPTFASASLDPHLFGSLIHRP